MNRIDATAQRLRRAAAARRLATVSTAPWSWDELPALPDWVLDDEAARRLALQVGARWFAPAVARCIDGPRLAALHTLLGPDTMAALVHDADAGGALALPAAAELPAALQDVGRSLLLGTLPSPQREAVAAVLGWHSLPQADRFDCVARAQAPLREPVAP